MDRKFSNFPSSEEVQALPVFSLAGLVVDVASNGARICGPAALDVNRFLADAAVRMAREIVNAEAEASHG